MSSCNEPGCTKAVYSLGLCRRHYLPTVAQLSEAERFWLHVDRSAGEAACWPWTGSATAGYGRFNVHGRPVASHRYAFLASGGQLTAAAPWVLHACDNPPCCNFAHLRAGTPAENAADKLRRGRDHYATRSVCGKGHPLSGANLLISQGARRCRTCAHVRMDTFKSRRSRDVFNAARGDE